MNTKIDSSTASVRPTHRQVDKLHERLFAAARKSGANVQQFQDALAYPGTELEEELSSVFFWFAKRMRGIITPVCAQDTGLIPKGWTLESDSLEGDIDLANLDLSSRLTQGSEWQIRVEEILTRAGDAYGSLGFVAALIKEKEKGREIFPVRFRRHCFVMPRTVLLDERRRRRVACFFHDFTQWCYKFPPSDCPFYCKTRFVRPPYRRLSAA